MPSEEEEEYEVMVEEIVDDVDGDVDGEGEGGGIGDGAYGAGAQQIEDGNDDNIDKGASDSSNAELSLRAVVSVVKEHAECFRTSAKWVRSTCVRIKASGVACTFKLWYK